MKTTNSIASSAIHVRGFTIIEFLIVIAIAGILLAIAIPAWNNRNNPTVVLKQNEWQCLKTEEREYQYTMQVGKIATVQTGRREECVQWKRRGS